MILYLLFISTTLSNTCAMISLCAMFVRTHHIMQFKNLLVDNAPHFTKALTSTCLLTSVSSTTVTIATA
jgi:hypothetical protein